MVTEEHRYSIVVAAETLFTFLVVFSSFCTSLKNTRRIRKFPHHVQRNEPETLPYFLSDGRGLKNETRKQDGRKSDNYKTGIASNSNLTVAELKA